MASDYLTRLFGLSGQVAVVIGGTGVLGGALCEGLARAGAAVVIAGRSVSRGYKRVEVVRALAGEAGFCAVDVESKESLQKLLDYTLGQYGKVDILVNCAGTSSRVPYLEIEDEDWQRVINGNLRATHWACQIFAPQMARQEDGGSILNIGSVTAHTPLSQVFAYSAAKAAVVNLTQNLARELAPSKIRVNVLCPGFFPTEQNRPLLTPERTESILEGTALGRFGDPEELLGAALLLVSRRAGSFMTGAAVYVDGGFTSTRF